MTDNNSTQSASLTLPVSNRPQMNSENLKTITCKVLESLEISPPSGTTIHGPDGDLFEHPIQIVLLGIDDDQAKLCFYAHPSLIVKQGPPLNQQCRKAWSNDPSSQLKNTNQPPPKNKAQASMPLHPIIQCETLQDTDDCVEILQRVAAVINLLSYLDLTHDEVTREAAHGLYCINSMVQDTVKYVARNIK